MGRKIKRVAMDFDPLNEECTACNGRGRDLTYRNVEALARLILVAGSDSVRGPRPHPYFASTPLDRVGPKMHELTAGLAGRPPRYGHDAIDGWRATDKLIEAAGLDPETWGVCEHCGGNGEEPGHKDIAALRDAWEEEPPPEGDAYQLWSTTTDPDPDPE